MPCHSEIRRVHSANYGVRGAEGVRMLNREGVLLARCTIERLTPCASGLGETGRVMFFPCTGR